MPKSNEKTSLLVKKATTNCSYIPPGSLQEDTIYDGWRSYNCACNNLPFWQESASKTTNWTANSYDFCMTPAYCYDKIIFTLCCRGNPENCEQNNRCLCEICICAISIPKISCCIIGGITAIAAGALGGIYDTIDHYCLSPAPEEQTMDISASQPIESKHEKTNTLNFKKNHSFKPATLDELKNKLNEWIANDDLESLLNFFHEKENFKFLKNETIYRFFRIELICLTIRNKNNKITLEARKIFISQLLDKGIIDGYLSKHGWITAPLLEALRSNYRHSSELLEFLCENNADVRKVCGKTKFFGIPSLLQLWIYDDFLNSQDEILLYKALILKNYENDNESEDFNDFLLKNTPHNALDKRLEAELSIKNENRTMRRNELATTLNKLYLEKNIILLIGQYSGLFSTLVLKPEGNKSHRTKKISQLIDESSTLFSRLESKELKSTNTMLAKYKPLPKMELLPSQSKQNSPNEPDWWPNIS